MATLTKAHIVEKLFAQNLLSKTESARIIETMSLLQNYFHSRFDTSPRTEIQHVTTAKVRSP